MVHRKRLATYLAGMAACLTAATAAPGIARASTPDQGLLTGTPAEPQEISRWSPGAYAYDLRQRVLAISVCSTYRHQWWGSCKTTTDAHTMYISISHQVYRLSLAAPVRPNELRAAMLMRRPIEGSRSYRASDFILTVVDRTGARDRIIVKQASRLTPAQVASLPKSLQPNPKPAWLREWRPGSRPAPSSRYRRLPSNLEPISPKS